MALQPYSHQHFLKRAWYAALAGMLAKRIVAHELLYVAIEQRVAHEVFVGHAVDVDAHWYGRLVERHYFECALVPTFLLVVEHIDLERRRRRGPTLNALGLTKNLTKNQTTN